MEKECKTIAMVDDSKELELPKSDLSSMVQYDCREMEARNVMGEQLTMTMTTLQIASEAFMQLINKADIKYLVHKYKEDLDNSDHPDLVCLKMGHIAQISDIIPRRLMHKSAIYFSMYFVHSRRTPDAEIRDQVYNFVKCTIQLDDVEAQIAEGDYSKHLLSYSLRLKEIAIKFSARIKAYHEPIPNRTFTDPYPYAVRMNT